MGDGASLTMREVPDFLVRARASLAAGHAEIDLGSFAAVDSSALAALIALRRDGGTVAPVLVNAPANLRKLALLYGVDDLLFSA